MWLLLKYTLLYAGVLSLVALGGMFAERSGIINIALEGIMVIGGLIGVVMINILDAAGVPPFLGIILTIIISGVAGMAYSSLLAFSAVDLKADQTIGGTAMNLLATALAVVVAKRINGNDSPKIAYNSTTNQVLSNQNFSFQVGPLTLNWFIIVAVVAVAASWFILYRTRFGMRLMACGEHPQAADSVGINVYRMRWCGVLISGFLGGIGGVAYIVPAVGDWNFEVGVAGMGFLALAVMIFGQWKPIRIAVSALLFGLFRALSNVYGG
ncbi:MAG: ABC transporter permease, partial [Clostridia bacterium]|nr:ABC transporter permease [Clostridia bacterium]